ARHRRRGGAVLQLPALLSARRIRLRPRSRRDRGRRISLLHAVPDLVRRLLRPRPPRDLRPLMTGARDRVGRLAGVALAALVAACQPLPHPFADDRPPAALLKVRGIAGVAIAPVEGEPAAVAATLGAAVASALLKRDIPASDKTTSLGSYQLYGRLEEARPMRGKASLTAHWRLYDARGETVGARSARLEGEAREWATGDASAIARLAKLSVEGLAPLLEEEAPVEASGGGRTRIAIR